MDIWEWVQNMKIFVSHVNNHQIASTTEEAQNNQVYKMTLSVDVIKSRLPTTPDLAQRSH